MIQSNYDGKTLRFTLPERVDSNNAPALEQEIQACVQANPAEFVIADCDDLVYISSAGLRVLLRVRKRNPNFKLINVCSEVYDILDMTGFSEIIEAEKAFRKLSVEGCEKIGQGANGAVYRIDRDTIVKVYLNPDALPEIQRERELARTAFVAGVPTAIPFDIVRIGESYGSVFELLDAKSCAQLLASGEKSVDEIAEMCVELAKQIHATVVKPGSMPDMRLVALDWAAFLRDYLPPEQSEKLYALIEAVPEDFHMLHGDYHIKNVMVQNGESLLIDMDTLCYGNPIFELGSMFNAYLGFAEVDHSIEEKFMGISYETAKELWEKMLYLYLETEDEARIREVERKAQIIGYARILRRRIRRNGFDSDLGRREIELCKQHLAELLPITDSLLY